MVRTVTRRAENRQSNTARKLRDENKVAPYAARKLACSWWWRTRPETDHHPPYVFDGMISTLFGCWRQPNCGSVEHDEHGRKTLAWILRLEAEGTQMNTAPSFSFVASPKYLFITKHVQWLLRWRLTWAPMQCQRAKFLPLAWERRATWCATKMAVSTYLNIIHSRGHSRTFTSLRFFASYDGT